MQLKSKNRNGFVCDTGNSTFSFEIAKNEMHAPRTGTVTVQAGADTKTITVRQFDEVSGYFNPINSDGTSETRASTEYNHSLAKWAMELAYAAYAPLPSGFAQFVPGAFMEDGIEPAQDVLEALGFTAQSYNYGKNDAVAHVIGHREIYADINYELSDNISGGNDDGYKSVEFFNDMDTASIGAFDSNLQPDLRSDASLDNITFDNGRDSKAFRETLNSDNTVTQANCANINHELPDNITGGSDNGAVELFERFDRNGANGTGGISGDDFQSDLRTDASLDNIRRNSTRNREAVREILNSCCMRTLVVVDIRGSTTWEDWKTDLGTQFKPKWGSFEKGMKTVLASLYGTGDTASCTECHGAGCEKCMGYLAYNNIENPIFLVTGHSLGAAVANLVADNLNSRTDAGNVYA